jgi:hypothetical protein
MKVLVSGARNWPDELAHLVFDKLCKLPRNTIIISGAAKGVDTLAEEFADDVGLEKDIFPANWDKHGKAAGPIRNQQMLEHGPDLVLCFFKNFEKSKGTKDMYQRAKKAGVKTIGYILVNESLRTLE